MDEKLLKLFKLANSLNEKQSKVFAQIKYRADDSQKLEISIRSKKDFSLVEKCELHLTNCSLIGWNNFVVLFENYVGGACNE